MSRKRKVEAWAVVFGEKVYDRYGYRAFPPGKPSRANLADFYGRPDRVVRLVEHSASADAVVRAAVKHRREHWHGAETTTPCTLCVAVERHLEAKK